MIALLVPLLLAASSPTSQPPARPAGTPRVTAPLLPAERAGIDALIAKIYRPYHQPDSMDAAWELPVFSAETTRLIARWQQVMPENELDGLNDGDWFCLCQDWDGEAFGHTVLSRERLRPGAAQARVLVRIARDATRSQRFILLFEKGQWRLDDAFSRDFPKGLKQALRETIAADEKLAK